MPRFDLASKSQLQSRDGGITKGGLMKNGFVEKDKDGETWCWQRPALVNTFSSPFAASGQGLYVSAAALWGVFNTGSAVGLQIAGPVPYILQAGTIDGGHFGFYSLGNPGNDFGTMTPGAWGSGGTVGSLEVWIAGTGTTILSIQGTHTQGRFTSVTLNGSSFLTSTAAMSTFTDGTGATQFGYTRWTWNGVRPISTGGSYAGIFAAPGPAINTVSFPGIQLSEFPDWAASISGPIMLKGTGTAYQVNGTAVTGISDPDYPTTTVKGVQYLDGTFYVLEPDKTVRNSVAAGDDPTDWPTDGFITAEFEPDAAVCLSKALNYIVVLGQWSTELFWDAGNLTGSPLLPVSNGVLLIGCATANSVAQTESTLIWMAQRKAENSTSHAGRFIAILVGNSYEELSTPDVCRVLDADDLASVRAVIVEMGGHSWYLLGLGTSGITLAFDMKSKLWYVWTRYAGGSPGAVSAISQINGLATGTLAGHGFSDGDPIVVAGVTPAGYNGTFNVNVTGTSAFTYPISTTGTGVGTGTSMTATPYTESAMLFAASLGFNGQQVAMDLSGNVYTLSLGAALDNGSIPINWRIRTIDMDEGNQNRKFAGEVAIVADVAGTATGMVRSIDDDYRTFGYFRRFDMDQVPNRANRWGAYVRRAWEWRYTDRERLRVQALDIDMTKGVT